MYNILNIFSFFVFLNGEKLMILQEKKIDGELFEKILTFGALNLQANIKEINDLNVFPVPDGDTGSNMYATLIGGIDTLQKEY